MYDVILVGSDGSDDATRAVTHAIGLGEQFDADVHAIGVVNTRRYGEPALSTNELVINEIEERVHADLDEVASRADDAGVEVVTTCCHGDPSEEILTLGDEIDADVTILGYQGRTHSGDHIGSVANKVVRSTDRPILLA